MSAGTIVTILKYIPWDQVVKNAPKALEAATELWDSVAKWKNKNAQQSVATQQSAMSETELLKAELDALRLSVGTLHEQMTGSATLIKELAEQNTRLIERVELNRKRMKMLAIATGVAFAVLVGLVVIQLVRT